MSIEDSCIAANIVNNLVTSKGNGRKMMGFVKCLCKKVAKCLCSSRKSYNFAAENRKKDNMSKQYASFYYFYFYFAGHCEAGSRI